jgi:hypothetical protein
MNEIASARAGWESFYVIVGSSGGALIGLQFVVISLLADRPNRTSRGGVQAFATPTVVHLTGALIISAIMSAPWPVSSGLSEVVGVLGLVGMVYAVVVVFRTLRQHTYVPVMEDWVWYTALPVICYAFLIVAAFLHTMNPGPLFFIGAAALGLLLIGIHNAWDTVTHIVLSAVEAAGDNQQPRR